MSRMSQPIKAHFINVSDANRRVHIVWYKYDMYGCLGTHSRLFVAFIFGKQHVRQLYRSSIILLNNATNID